MSGSDDVWAVIELVEAAEIIGAVKDGEGSSGLNGSVSGDLPSAETLAVYAIAPTQEAMTRSDGQLVNVNEDGTMADVEGRGAAIGGEIVAVLESCAFTRGAEEGRAVVNGFADSVGTLEIKT